MSAIKPRTARVTIFQGDDIARLAELDREVERADAEVKALTKEKADTKAAQEALTAAQAVRDGFAERAEERGVVVQLIARPRLRWRELMREHGPRPDHEEDAALGVNMDTLPDVLVPESVDREMSSIEGDLTDFLESLSDFDYYDRLFLTAFSLNRGSAAADPTRRLLSSSRTSAATSN